MDLLSVPSEISLTIYHGMVAWKLDLLSCPFTVKMFDYVDDIMLTFRILQI